MYQSICRKRSLFLHQKSIGSLNFGKNQVRAGFYICCITLHQLKISKWLLEKLKKKKKKKNKKLTHEIIFSSHLRKISMCIFRTTNKILIYHFSLLELIPSFPRLFYFFHIYFLAISVFKSGGDIIQQTLKTRKASWY